MKNLLSILFLLIYASLKGQNEFPKLLTDYSLNNSESRVSIKAYVYASGYADGAAIAEKKPSEMWNTIKFTIVNNTNHELRVKFNTVVTLIDGKTINDIIGKVADGVYLAPNGTWPVPDPGDLPGFGRGHLTTTQDYKIIQLVNSKEEAENKNIIKGISINSLAIVDKTLEKSAAEAKNKEVEEAAAKEATKNESAVSTSESSKKIQETSESTSTVQNTDANAVSSKTQTPKSQQQINAELEQAHNQARQNEYDNWKVNATNQRAKMDAVATAGSLSLMYLLGGFVYKNMGRIPDPNMVYEPIAQKAKPRYFMNTQLGYSYSSVPFLYESKISTMSGGQTVVKYSYQGFEGSFLNLGGSTNIGFTSDYYSFYGSFGIIGGITPNMQGSYVGTNYGGGVALGFKPIKVYSRYKKSGDANYYLKSDKVEEENGIHSKLNSEEIETGIQFTFGGKANSNFQRTHLYVGMLQKAMPLNNTLNGFEAFYNATKGVITRYGKMNMNGYSIEIRKDHGFDLFFRYYPEHYYYGDVNGFNSSNGTMPAKLEKPFTSYLEIGFYRCLDLFN